MARLVDDEVPAERLHEVEAVLDQKGHDVEGPFLQLSVRKETGGGLAELPDRGLVPPGGLRTRGARSSRWPGPAGGSSSANMMIACDKNGGAGSVTDAGFGGNHDGDGGHILRADGSVKWIPVAEWGASVWGGAHLASVAGY